jgi:hypothetical protein
LFACSVALGSILACSSSTAPPDPFVGQWKVAVVSSLAADSLVPDSFVAGVTKTQGAYHLTFPTLMAYHDDISLGLSDTASASGFTGRGDSVYIGLGAAGFSCYLSLTGTASGGSAAGSAILLPASCPLGSGTLGTWAAVKQ